jgi:hypothetical protein
VPVKMSEEALIYGLSGSDDFVDVSGVFRDAAQGMALTSYGRDFFLLTS